MLLWGAGWRGEGFEPEHKRITSPDVDAGTDTFSRAMARANVQEIDHRLVELLPAYGSLTAPLPDERPIIATELQPSGLKRIVSA